MNLIMTGFPRLLVIGASMMLFMGIDLGRAFVVKPQTLSTLSASARQITKPTLDVRKERLFSYGPVATTTTRTSSSTTFLPMATDGDKSSTSNLPFWLDPGTRGGAIFLSFILFLLPLVGYSIATNVFGVDEVEAGKWIGVGFTATASFLWVGTYIFRVATKDMTYAKQLKDYENAVIAKRLEELDDDEIQALVEEIERDEF
mmetsp:Transcript_6162/g.9608  ORF Transcript_6162/g.9608 Transcript_6162/m.9608 type:complete len:202 (-) Transcript_6162:164-769(-)